MVESARRLRESPSKNTEVSGMEADENIKKNVKARIEEKRKKY
jgi:hypothetical protein